MLKEVYTSKSLISAVNCGTWIVLFTLVVGFISLFEPNIFKNGTLFTLIWSTGITTMQLILKYYILVGSIELLEVFHKQDVAEKYGKLYNILYFGYSSSDYSTYYTIRGVECCFRYRFPYIEHMAYDIN